MGSRERPADRGGRLAHALLLRIGTELRQARRDRGLSVDTVARAAGSSNAQVSRIERGLALSVSLAALVKLAAVVGLELVAKLYAGASPVRDAAHVALLEDLRLQLHGSLRWAVEVPLPISGDQRSWDAMVLGFGWRLGIEAESAPRDAQALLRRLHLKERDGAVDGLILALRDTRTARQFLSGGGPALAAAFPISSRRALAALRAGVQPPGNAIVIVPRRRRPRPRR